jgi:hypothetical protein
MVTRMIDMIRTVRDMDMEGFEGGKEINEINVGC